MQTLFVVSHTHWDREWYEPFQVFRLRLVKCIDKLLHIFATDPDYKHFLLDGQTIVLDDYLEVRPDREQTLRDLVSAGKLHIGPWYVLPDEFLVSGEALIRNLMHGIRSAQDFGGTMRIGYLPDQFGHISQMPQILRGLGLGVAVLWRGLADEPTELWWDAPDGTRVLVCYLRDSYSNAAWLPRDDTGFVAGIGKLHDSLALHAVTPNILLMNGTDHMEPWSDLSRLLNIAREKIAGVQIVHASLPMYVEQVQRDISQIVIASREAAKQSPSDLRTPALQSTHTSPRSEAEWECGASVASSPTTLLAMTLPIVHGELRSPKRSHLLPGVASTRMWIKQRNAHAQMLLEKWAEPFAAFAAFQTNQQTNRLTNHQTIQLLNLAWKYLLQNHPHDSICGCGVDQTHAEMAPRFDWAEQIAEAIINDSLAAIAAKINIEAMANAIPLIVFNPVAGPRTDIVTATLEVPGSLEDFVLLDDTGTEIPFQIVSRRVEEYYRAEATGESLGMLLGMAQGERVLGMAIQDALVRTDESPIRLDVTLSAQGEPNPAIIKEGLPQIQQLTAQNKDATFDVRVHSLAKFEIELVARDMPGFGYRMFQVKSQKAKAKSKTKSFESLVLENEFYRIEPNPTDGTLTITDKATGAVYRGTNRFVDGGDRGDLYNYCPPENDALISQPSAPPGITVERGAARQSLHTEMNCRLPTKLADDRASRAQELVDESIVTTVSLYPGVRRIDFRVQVDNRARNHRLRVEFPAPIVTAYANADQAFDVVTRSLDLPNGAADWVEQPRPEAPMQNFVSVSDGKIGLTLATRGLPEYEARPHRNPPPSNGGENASGTTLALTLLRCVGWLSRNDLATRTGDAGPQRETPGAQEIGAHVFEYALIPHAGDWHNSFAEVHAFATPMRAVTTSARSPLLPSTPLRSAQDAGEGQGERSAASFVEASPREFVFSAIKLAEEGEGLVVRGYNIGNEPIDARIVLLSTLTALSVNSVEGWHGFTRAARVNLNEKEIAPVELHEGCAVELHVRAKEIVTVRFE